MQAAYDVLLNKTEWKSNTIARRDVWQPVQGTLSAPPEAALFATQGAAWKMQMQIFDEFRRFPSNLHANLKSLPDGWWSLPFVTLEDDRLMNATVQVRPRS